MSLAGHFYSLSVEIPLPVEIQSCHGELARLRGLEREIAGLSHISKIFARYGVTTVHHEGGSLAAMQMVRSRGDLRHRISYEATGKELDPLHRRLQRFRYLLHSSIATGWSETSSRAGWSPQWTSAFSRRTEFTRLETD
jgi:hypothetical protein